MSGGAHSLTLVAEGPTFDWPIVLRRNDNGAQARICVDVTPLIGPSARSVANQRLSIDGQTGSTCVEMAGVDKTVVVHLSGDLPVEGDFKGPIGLVVETGCRYAGSLTYPEPVEIGFGVERLGSSSVTYRLGVFAKGAPDAAAEGHFTHVYVGREGRRPAPLPPAWRGKLEAILIQG